MARLNNHQSAMFLENSYVNNSQKLWKVPSEVTMDNDELENNLWLHIFIELLRKILYRTKNELTGTALNNIFQTSISTNQNSSKTK